MKYHILNTFRRSFTLITVVSMSCVMSFTTSNAVESNAELPKGWLLWHSYSEYAALDSKLYLRTPDDKVKVISGDFVHAMNGSFGITPEQIAFMAIDNSADEWDIYLYDNGNITNLTKNSGFRNEDPKWSPDGKSIVFKRGYWSSSVNDFVYNLALLNVESEEIIMLTDDTDEEAMPCYSEDGKYIYYASYINGIGSICRMDIASHNIDTVYSENNITAYYPITADRNLYFTKWHDADNRCNQIMKYDGRKIHSLPFNSDLFDCSDACPVNENMMIYSSTADGDYDLFFYNGEYSVKLTELCGNKNELGADYYSFEKYENYLNNSRIMGDVNCNGEFNIADVVLLQKWLLDFSNTELADWKAGDLCEDDRLDVFDFCLMKRALIQTMAHNPLNLLIGMEYEDAVRNAYISKSEYNYQIAGNLKSTIEDKMGRPLDYSIDRFYFVNNEKLGLNSDTKYLYNTSTMDVYYVNEDTKMNCATWYWKGTKAALYGIDDDAEKQNEFLDAMEFYGITKIYYSIGANKLIKNKDMVEAFVKNAYARNMKVYLVTGEKMWLYEDSYQTAIYNIFDKVKEYNSLVSYDARLAGVSYDVEVWTNSEFNWKNNDAARYQQVKFIETAQKYAESKNLSVSYCLPFWIVQYDYTDDEGVTRNIYDSITQIANDTILMVYRDSAGAVEKLVTGVQNNAKNSVFYYIEKNNCNLEIAVEVNESSEGDYVTFYEEEKENPGYVNVAIATIKSNLEAYKYRTTFAIHHAIALYEYYLSM
ncbi:MAG: hypothetical protein K2N27_05130, partial [Ruminococcus sp.]|nr:hypothetical protein [Ruminococcus sp.]